MSVPGPGPHEEEEEEGGGGALVEPLVVPLVEPLVVPLVDAREVQFWTEAVGGAESPETQGELHLGRLRDFLQVLLTHTSNMSSTTEVMRRLPFLGQLLGRLCWTPRVTADAVCRRLLLQSMWSLYSEEPSSPVEKMANRWIQSVLCQLATGEEADNAVTRVLVEHAAEPPEQYHLRVLRKLVSLLSEEAGGSCSSLSGPSLRCSCDTVLAASETCVPLVTCPEAAPLIGALLQRAATCSRATLSPGFLDAVSAAYLSNGLSLEDGAVMSLWCHSLPSLEGAVLSLLDSVLLSPALPHATEQRLARSVLPKACARHSSLFLVVNDIFRSLLQQVEGHQSVLFLVQSFTRCFLREVARLQPQERAPLKAFFTNSPRQLLQPLVVLPTEMPPEAWGKHLTWIVQSLQRLTEEEEEERDEDTGTRGQRVVFEAWFLLAQCAHWVEAALRLLASAPAPAGPGHPELLWLLTFYHHPTDRGHHRTLQLPRVREAWSHCRSLLLPDPSPLDTSGPLRSLVELLSLQAQPRPQPRPLSPALVLGMLVNAAVVSTEPGGGGRAAEVFRAVVQCCGLATEALRVLSSVELGLAGGDGSIRSPGDASRGQLRRTRALRDALTQDTAMETC